MDARNPQRDLIPSPRRWRPAMGALPCAALCGVAADADEAVAPSQLAAEFLAPALGRRLPMAGDGVEGPLLRLRARDGLPAEGYGLTITIDGIELVAAGRPGFARGLATLYQLICQAGGGALPCGVLDDGPAFGWRGLLLDSGRHFQPVETVRAVIDRLAVYRFNVLHWHLTEDQGWRLEVPGLPRLTSVGSRRRQQDGGVHEGFYTANDVREVVAYAGARGITVVPEIEMPGHCQAALAAYPELSCRGRPLPVQTQWGVFPDIYCAGNDEVFAFLEAVLGHVLSLFPSEFVHVGGDEAPHDRWRDCPGCRVRRVIEGLADEHELQSWFIRRMGRWLAARGRRLVGWDEILDGGLAGTLPGAVVQSWRGVDGAVAAARAGHDTIVSPTSHAYFDYDPGTLDLARVLAFDPVPPGLAPAERAHVLGGAANLWTEYVPTELIDRRLFPRLLAMAEALWSRPAARDAGDFLARTRRQTPVFAALGVTPGAGGRPLRVTGTFDHARNRHVVTVSPQGALAEAVAGRAVAIGRALVPVAAMLTQGLGGRPEDLRVPTDSWAPLTGDRLEIDADHEGVLACFRLMVEGGPCGAPEVIELCGHRALGRPVTLVSPAGHGDAARLTDGIHGTWRRDDGRWCGCEGVDLDAVIDLGAASAIGTVTARFLQDANARIFLPRAIHILVSDDGRTWREAGGAGHDLPDRVQDKVVLTFAVRPTAAARWLRLRAVNLATCPAWHPEAGRPGWVYADEIVVRDLTASRAFVIPSAGPSRKALRGGPTGESD